METTGKLFIAQLFLLSFSVQDSCGNYNLKLVNGKTSHEGIIQIKYNKTWGTILDYDKMANVRIMNAFVVCRSLGYKKAIQGNTVWFDPNNNTYWPRSLRCTGRELNIQQCPIKIRTNLDGSVTAPPYSAFYVICGNLSQADKDLQVRILSSDNKNLGMVEQSYKLPPSQIISWNMICVSYHMLSGLQWYTQDAQVVCRMLGYKQAVGHLLYSVKTFRAFGAVIRKRYHCSGKESTIAECAQSKEPYSCSDKDYYAGVFCKKNTTLSQIKYRLSEEDTPNNGYLEVRQHGVWGTVCSSLAKLPQQFVCHQLGFLGKTGEISPQNMAPQTSISWEINELCKSTNDGKCLENEMWKLHTVNPCPYPVSVTCKIAEPPKYNVRSGCIPVLTIDRKGLTDQEKKLIVYYRVRISLYRFYKGSNDSLFFIPGNLTNLSIGDGQKYVKGFNKKLLVGRTYYLEMTAAYQDKSGKIGFGDLMAVSDLPSFQTSKCPTTQQNTLDPTIATKYTTPSDSVNMRSKSMDTGEIVGIVIGVILAIVLIIVFAVFTYKKCNVRGSNESEETKGSWLPLSTKDEVVS